MWHFMVQLILFLFTILLLLLYKQKQEQFLLILKYGDCAGEHFLNQIKSENISFNFFLVKQII